MKRGKHDRLGNTWHEGVNRLLPFALLLAAPAAVAVRFAGGSLAAQDALTLAAVFFAAIASSIAGFAFSAIAASMLIHVYDDPTEMVRVLLVCSIAVQLYCNWRLLPTIRCSAAGAYLAGGVLTVPLGVLILQHAESHVYGLSLGAFLVVYAAYALARPFTIRGGDSTVARVCVGALGGITGGLAAFPGAFIVMWCSARGLSKDAQRAICQPYIFLMQIVTLACLEALDRGHSDALADLWSFVPVSMLAAWLGFSAFQRVSAAQFKTIVLTLLGLSGSLMMAKGF